jgi:hypothetical protein
MNEPHYVFFYFYWIDFGTYWIHYALGQLGYVADRSYSNGCRFGRGSPLRVGL